MKAIKIASGVAVSALALAISAQANAAAHEGGATETEWSFTGSMEAVYVVDMKSVDANGDEATVMDVDLDEGGDFDDVDPGDAWGLEAELSIVHGPFSSGLIFTADDENDVDVVADDIVITDGAISFGQVGSLIDTHEYTYDMDEGGSEGADVEAGIRYTMDNLKVQVEGLNDTDDIDTTDTIGSGTEGTQYGIGAQYTGEADALSYIIDGQFRASSQAPDGSDAFTYVGAGVTYTTDMVTVAAALNNFGQSDKVTEYGFSVTATPVENLSLYVKGMDHDAADTFETDATNSMEVLAGASYTAGMITVTGEYLFTAVESGGDEVFGEVVYTDGPLSAYGDVTLANIDADEADDAQIGFGVSYTQDNGVVYAADYDMQGDVQSLLVLSAAYAF